VSIYQVILDIDYKATATDCMLSQQTNTRNE